MFDDTIKKSQCIPEFLSCHVPRRSSIERLIQIDETLFDITQNGREHFAGNRTIGIAGTELNERCNHSQTTQSAKFVGIIEDTALQRDRFSFLLRNNLNMSQDCLLNLTDTLRW